MAHQSAAYDIEDEISSWGFSTPLSAYQQSSVAGLPENKTRGRGRGITNPCHMAKNRLASEIDDLKAHAFPMGHLPITEELLARSAENEITPMLRQLGLSSHDEDVSSRTTRKNPILDDEIRFDGKLPIILNADLFKRDANNESDDGIENTEKFDPKLPMHEQFSTIPELALANDFHEPSTNKSSPKKPKSNKPKNNSTNDSGLGTSTTSSSTQPKKEKPKTKKKKWRKMTPAELDVEPILDRYEERYSIGVHDNSSQSVYAPRQLHGADGLKGLTNMSNESSFEDIEDEISSWGYSMSLSDFERSRQSEEYAQLKFNGIVIGRGQGITNKRYMETVRMASDINSLKAHPFPIGHLPTTSEVLEAPPENEITPLLRKLGISGHDWQISSRTTRPVPKQNEEIRLDRKIPVILNGDLFGASFYSNSDIVSSENDEPYDPTKPLQEQFKTIKEFAEIESPNIQKTVVLQGRSNSTCPNSSRPSSSPASIEISSHSTPANDDSSSATSLTTYSTGEQYSIDQWCAEPLLNNKHQVYTPRQLYQIKKMHACRMYSAA